MCFYLAAAALSARSVERAGERAAVGGAGVDVLLRLDLGGGRLADLDGERLVDRIAVERALRLSAGGAGSRRRRTRRHGRWRPCRRRMS